jgi:hypothetical protein
MYLYLKLYTLIRMGSGLASTIAAAIVEVMGAAAAAGTRGGLAMAGVGEETAAGAEWGVAGCASHVSRGGFTTGWKIHCPGAEDSLLERGNIWFFNQSKICADNDIC